jgi:hypothetical protein
MSTKRIIIIFGVLAVIIASIIANSTIREKHRMTIIDDFQSECKNLAIMFDSDYQYGSHNFDFVNMYSVGKNGYATIIDHNSYVLHHPNEQFIDVKLPIVPITARIAALLEDNKSIQEDVFLNYVFNGDEKLAYIHTVDNEIFLLITASLDDY